MSEPVLESIVHPTDFSPAGLNAFAHALRLGVAAKSLLYLVHAEGDKHDADWARFPRVREMLANWGMIAPGAPQSAVAKQLGVKVEKRIIEVDDPVHGVGTFIDQHPCDLMVLMTHARSGARRWLEGSIAEAAARRSRARTLFLRENQEGFVDPATGALSLKTILLPVDDALAPWEASRWADAIRGLVAPGAQVHLLHVGPPGRANVHGIEGAVDVRQGPVVETIIGVAAEIGAGLIVMPTAGHDGVLDALRGGVTERVLREAPCPVLAVPN